MFFCSNCLMVEGQCSNVQSSGQCTTANLWSQVLSLGKCLKHVSSCALADLLCLFSSTSVSECKAVFLLMTNKYKKQNCGHWRLIVYISVVPPRAEHGSLSHLSPYMSENGLTCKLCNLTCHNKSNLRRHILSHSGEKRFSCKLCGKSLTRRSALIYHIKMQHPEFPLEPGTSWLSHIPWNEQAFMLIKIWTCWFTF